MWIDKASVRNRGDAHFCGFGGGDASKGVLDDEARVGSDVEFCRCAQLDVGMWFAVFDLVTGNDDIEERRQLMSI